MPELTLGYASHDAVNVIKQFQAAGPALRSGRHLSAARHPGDPRRHPAGFDKVKAAVRPEGHRRPVTWLAMAWWWAKNGFS